MGRVELAPAFSQSWVGVVNIAGSPSICQGLFIFAIISFW